MFEYNIIVYTYAYLYQISYTIKMSYYCDYNWMPLTFSQICCDEIDMWENFFSFTNFSMCGRLCCTSIDFHIRMIETADGYIIKQYDEQIAEKDLFSSLNQEETEKKFIELINYNL